MTGSITATALVAAAAELLEEAGYERVRLTTNALRLSHTARMYEDQYGVVELVVFETWADLASNWLDAQAALVDLISRYCERGDAKAWEGYLVLLTPGVAPMHARHDVELIARDTVHVRKLIGTGEELASPSDVRRILLPLLPLQAFDALAEPRSALDLLPELLARRGIPEESSRVVIQAFLEQENPVEALLRDQQRPGESA